MSILNAISSALGGKGQAPTQGAAPAQNSSAPAQGSASNQMQSFDNHGVLSGADQGQNPSQSQGQNQQTNSTPSGAQSIEDILFAPDPANTSNPANANNVNIPSNLAAPNAPDAPAEIAPGLTAQQLINNLSSVNFMGVIPQETIDSALGGNAADFNKIISTVAQLSAAVAVKQSLDSSKALMDQRFQTFDSSLTNKISESKYTDVLADPRFSNPFIRPMAQNLMERLRAREPSITPEQIKETLPKLIEYSMNKFQSNSQASFNQSMSHSLNQGQPQSRNVPTEINFDEVFNG